LAPAPDVPATVTNEKEPARRGRVGTSPSAWARSSDGGRCCGRCLRCRRRRFGDDEMPEQHAEGLGLKSFSAERAGGDRGEGTPPRDRTPRPPARLHRTARTSRRGTRAAGGSKVGAGWEWSGSDPSHMRLAVPVRRWRPVSSSSSRSLVPMGCGGGEDDPQSRHRSPGR